MDLELEINEFLKITVETVDDAEKDAKTSKNQTNLLLQLWDNNSKKTSLTRRVIRWPIGQSLPEEISYLEDQEIVRLKGKTTKSDIPFPKSKIESLTASSAAKSKSTAKTKTYSSFAVDPVKISDITEISKAVGNVIDAPLKEKRWKQLIEKLEGLDNADINGGLPAFEQARLFEAIKLFSNDGDSEQEMVENILKAIVESKILTFRNEDSLLRLCIEKGAVDIVELVMFDSSRVLSEFVIAQLLKIAVGKSEKKMRKRLKDVLNRSYSKKSMIEAVSEVLSAQDAVEIMTVLVEIYKDFDSAEQNLHTKALSLITILMDSFASRLVYEDDLHPKFASISNFIIEIHALVGTFSRFDSAVEAAKNDENQTCIVRRVPLVKNKLW